MSERARGGGEKRARPSKRQQGGKRVEERKRTKERKENKEGRSDRDGCGSCAALQCDIRRQHTLVASRPFYGTPSANQLSYTRALLRVSFGDSAYGPVLSSPPSKRRFSLFPRLLRPRRCSNPRVDRTLHARRYARASLSRVYVYHIRRRKLRDCTRIEGNVRKGRFLTTRFSLRSRR